LPEASVRTYNGAVTGLPYVTISYAQSVDGRIAALDGSSQWISGERSLRLAHRLRRDNDAIAVGIGTVLRDDPELTCRLRGRRSLGRSPQRAVFDSRLRLPLGSKIVGTASEHPTTVFAAESADRSKRESLESRGVRVVLCRRAEDGGIEIRQALETLAASGCTKLFVEGGSRIITSFLRAGLVDRMLIVTSPLIIGEGVSAIGDLGRPTLDACLRPRRSRPRRMGPDLVWELTFAPERSRERRRRGARS